MQVYVINLDRNPERLEFISEKLSKIDVPFERIEAVDGRALPEEYISEFRENSKRDNGWMVGQIGCFLSHQHSWKALLESEDEYALILEDDVHLSDSVKAFVDDDSWIPEDADVVRLESTTNWVKMDKVTEAKGREIYRMNSDSWCAGSYILSKKAARKLLDAEEKKWLPTDFFIFAKSISPMAEALTIYQVVPTLSCQDKFLPDEVGKDEQIGFDSDIETYRNSPSKDTTPFLVKAKRGLKDILAPFLGYVKTGYKE